MTRLRVLDDIEKHTQAAKQSVDKAKKFHLITIDTMDKPTFQRQTQIIDEGIKVATESSRQYGKTYPLSNYKQLFKTSHYNPDEIK
jgi:hypothetical protein